MICSYKIDIPKMMSYIEWDLQGKTMENLWTSYVTRPWTLASIKFQPKPLVLYQYFGFSNQTGGIVDTTENEQKCEELENIARLPRVLLIVWPRKRTGWIAASLRNSSLPTSVKEEVRERERELHPPLGVGTPRELRWDPTSLDGGSLLLLWKRLCTE